jgi:hypothetical protein
MQALTAQGDSEGKDEFDRTRRSLAQPAVEPLGKKEHTVDPKKWRKAWGLQVLAFI